MTSGSLLLSDSSLWELRYVLLLWLSLICMIPFDLSRFDDVSKTSAGASTASKLEAVGLQYLGVAGKEREGAAVLLGRLFLRCVSKKMIINGRHADRDF